MISRIYQSSADRFLPSGSFCSRRGTKTVETEQIGTEVISPVKNKDVVVEGNGLCRGDTGREASGGCALRKAKCSRQTSLRRWGLSKGCGGEGVRQAGTWGGMFPSRGSWSESLKVGAWLVCLKDNSGDWCGQRQREEGVREGREAGHSRASGLLGGLVSRQRRMRAGGFLTEKRREF